jgi:peptidoglycan/LPS O-acetylase OafA/YrhL
MALGLFPRRLDAIIVVWLGITFANELTIDAPIFEKLFAADDSGFFMVGLLTYQYYRGRRDARLWALSALALGTAVFQSIHKLERLGAHTGVAFDPWVAAAICVVSLGLVFAATRIKRLPFSTPVVLAAGGITYPLYLLHMQLGYVVLTALAPTDRMVLATTAIIAGAVFLAFVVWRVFELPAHRAVRNGLNEVAGRSGLSSRGTSVAEKQLT